MIVLSVIAVWTGDAVGQTDSPRRFLPTQRLPLAVDDAPCFWTARKDHAHTNSIVILKQVLLILTTML